MFKRKKRPVCLYSISVHKKAVHLAILKFSPSSELSSGLMWQDRSYELVVNDELLCDEGYYDDAIKELLARYPQFPRNNQPLVIVLDSNLAREVSIERPELSQEDLVLSLPWKVKDLIPIPGDRIIADYYEPAAQASNTDMIHVVATDRDTLKPILELVHSLNFDVRGITNGNMAFRYWLPEKEQAIVVLQTPYGKNELHIVAKQQKYLLRELTRTQALNDLDLEDEYGIHDIAVEMQRSIDFYVGLLRQPPLQKALLATTHLDADDICEKIQAHLGLPCEKLPYPDWAKELGIQNFTDISVLSGVCWLVNQAEEDLDKPQRLSIVQRR